jgi:NADH-quinone oxidoreductase subunit K
MSASAAHPGLWVAALLFVTGLGGLLARRNLIFVLLSVEIMLSASALAFVAAGSRWGAPDGQVMFLFILALAAAETAVALALILRASREFGTLDPQALRDMTG